MLEGFSSQPVIEQANALGLKTQKDQLILWSGLGKGNQGVKLSQDFAKANGGMTLEMTPEGKWLDRMDLFGAHSPFSEIEARYIWSEVSKLMIQQGSGQVRAITGSVHPKSIYRVEQSEILMNEKILGIDEISLKPKFDFSSKKTR